MENHGIFSWEIRDRYVLSYNVLALLVLNNTRADD
jgi:hypothetical protein